MIGVNEIAEGCADLADIIKAKAKCKVMHIISDKHTVMQVGETTEQDCLDMGWKFHCVGCTRTWPIARSLKGHASFELLEHRKDETLGLKI